MVASTMYSVVFHLQWNIIFINKIMKQGSDQSSYVTALTDGFATYHVMHECRAQFVVLAIIAKGFCGFPWTRVVQYSRQRLNHSTSLHFHIHHHSFSWYFYLSLAHFMVIHFHQHCCSSRIDPKQYVGLEFQEYYLQLVGVLQW